MINNRWSRKKRLHVNTEISLTPLIDTALTLLVIFIIAAPLNNGTNVTPIIKSVIQPNQEICQVFIDDLEQVFINKNLVELDDFTQTLKDLIGESKTPVAITISKNANCDMFFNIYNKIRAAGAQYVALPKNAI